MQIEEMLKKIKEADDLLEQLQKFEIYETESKKSSLKIISMSMVRNSLNDLKEDIERVQLAQ